MQKVIFVAFSKENLKKLKRNLSAYGKTSKRLVCDACGKRSLLSASMIEKLKSAGKESKVYCPRCGKLIRTTDFF